MSLRTLTAAAAAAGFVWLAAGFSGPGPERVDDAEAGAVYGGFCGTFRPCACGIAGDGMTHMPYCSFVACSAYSGFNYDANGTWTVTAYAYLSCGGTCGTIASQVAPCATSVP